MSGGGAPAGREVLVVIVNYRTAALTLRGVRSLEGEREALPDLEVVVVENDSGDAEALRAGLREGGLDGWAHLRVSPVNGGFAAGNNVAVREALAGDRPPRYVMLLNPDAAIRPGAVRILRDFMDAHPEVGIAGSGLENADGSDWNVAFRFPTVWSELESGLRIGLASRLLRRWVVAQRMTREAQEIDWVPGAAMMIRREVFDAVGLMDESYFLYYEETDFCLAARRAGWRCWYVPESRVVHIAGQSTGVTVRDVRPKRYPPYLFESRRRYFAKNHGLAYAAAADAAFLAGYAVRTVRDALGRESPDPPHFLGDFVRHSVLVPGNQAVAPPRTR